MSDANLRFNVRWKIIRIFLFGQVAYFTGNGVPTERLFEEAQKINKTALTTREVFEYLKENAVRIA